LLYFETGGVNWSICTESNNGDCESGRPFMSGAHECRWAGINCNKQRQVTGIHLDKSNLVGNLPAELGDLDNLMELVMDDNDIAGTIPTTLGKLDFLQVIDLDNNKLSGEIPLELYNASSLRVLDLDSNLLTGIISPLMAQQWPNLYFVQLDKNAFIGGIPSELATLPSLRYLSMFMNGFSEPMPLELCHRDDVTLYADCNICRTTDSCCTACLNQR
jgi:Leucine rich repeat